jgi:hypothetical protein
MTIYYTLIASLPALPKSFDAGPSPITASTLKRRLSILTDEHREVVDRLASFFRWDRQPVQRTEAEVIEMHQRLNRQLSNTLARTLLEHRFEMRTLVAAVRCQRDGRACPALPQLPVSETIRRHWNQPGFQLSRRYHWLNAFCQAMDNNEPIQAQRVLFSELWDYWSRLSQQYHFCFETLILYLARWEILHRWASQNAEVGKDRFSAVLERVLSQTPAEA